jgi:hypothetical protein
MKAFKCRDYTVYRGRLRFPWQPAWRAIGPNGESCEAKTSADLVTQIYKFRKHGRRKTRKSFSYEGYIIHRKRFRFPWQKPWRAERLNGEFLERDSREQLQRMIDLFRDCEMRIRLLDQCQQAEEEARASGLLDRAACPLCAFHL